MWTALDIFIGLALCYALISLFCTAIQEFIAQMLDLRGALLVQALHSINFAKLAEKLGTNFLANPGNLGSWQSGTPQILSRTPQEVIGASKPPANDPLKIAPEAKKILVPNRRLMSDPTPENLAKTISSGMNLIKEGVSALTSDTAINELEIPDGLKARLLALSEEARKDVDKVKAEVEKWCGDFLAEVNHWFTRRAQVVSLIIGFAVALALNVDTIELATKLSNDPVLREAAVKVAGQLVADGKLKDCPKLTTETKPSALAAPPKAAEPTAAPSPPASSTLASGAKPTTGTNPQAPATPANSGTTEAQGALGNVKNCLKSVQTIYPIPLGWDMDAPLSRHFLDYLTKIIGLLLTAIALSLGSRFWFDTLKNLLALRTGGQPKAETK